MSLNSKSMKNSVKEVTEICLKLREACVGTTAECVLFHWWPDDLTHHPSVDIALALLATTWFTISAAGILVLPVANMSILVNQSAARLPQIPQLYRPEHHKDHAN